MIIPWLLSAGGILTLWLISRNVHAGWWIGFAVDALYMIYFWHTAQWGLIPASIAYSAVRIGYLVRKKI